MAVACPNASAPLIFTHVGDGEVGIAVETNFALAGTSGENFVAQKGGDTMKSSSASAVLPPLSVARLLLGFNFTRRRCSHENQRFQFCFLRDSSDINGII